MKIVFATLKLMSCQPERAVLKNQGCGKFNSWNHRWHHHNSILTSNRKEGFKDTKVCLNVSKNSWNQTGVTNIWYGNIKTDMEGTPWTKFCIDWMFHPEYGFPSHMFKIIRPNSKSVFGFKLFFPNISVFNRQYNDPTLHPYYST